ncbi:TBC1 domain family member 31 isoform X2 [Melanerpes formicivorus]|uniref:TBC1 domain family member 31 isoform X2 n=1 Tax=Melanerpes formicivorus TaxID=211600 RepID=UPI00358FC5D7
MESCDVGGRQHGPIWHRKPGPAAPRGVIVNIIHSVKGYHSKTIRFLNVAFDSSGDSLLAGDHQGNIYVFDLSGNRFYLVQRTTQPCTALAFNLRRRTEFLVALADCSIKCFDTETKELVSWMRGHDSSVSSISVHGSGRYAITTSADTAQLWDLDTFQRKRKLNVRQSVGIQKPLPPTLKVVEDWSKCTPGANKLAMRVTSGRSDQPWKSKGPKIQTRLLKVQANSSLENKENELPGGLKKERLRALLKGFGEYPAKYRMFVWRSLLQLPENHLAFRSLIDKGTHSAFVNIHKEYPIKSRKLLRVLQRTLSALAHWSAIFAETPYIPLLAFPFVKLFQNNQLICFEVVATVVVNFCQHWFEYFPNPPVNVLSTMENVLAHHDKELLEHLIKCSVTSQVYAWPLLETLFSEVLTREEWLKVFDNIFSNHPSYFLMIVVAYIICSRAPLLRCNKTVDFEYFFHHHNNLDIDVVIKKAYHLMEATPLDIHPQHMLDDFIPLTKGQYPAFNKYPKFIVDYQTQERERIRQDEIEYLRERQIAHEREAKAQEWKAEDEAWYQKQELLQKAEEQRRKMLLEEEEKLAEQRQRLAAARRELKVKELQFLDASRRRFLKYQQDQRQTELKRLEDEIARKASIREQETAAALQDVEAQWMELESQRQLFEQHLIKDQEAVTREIKEEVDAHQRKVDLEDRLLQRLMEIEKEERQKAQTVAEENLAKAEQKRSDADWRLRALQKLRSDDRDREKRYEEIAKVLHDNRVREAELLNAMREAEEKKWKGVTEKKAQLEEEQKAAAAADEHQKQFVEDRTREALELAEKLQRKEACFETLPDLRARRTQRGVELQQVPRSGNVCLNDLSASESSLRASLDRRRDLARQERDLMAEVRQLRQKLTARARAKHPTPPLPATKWTP